METFLHIGMRMGQGPLDGRPTGDSHPAPSGRAPLPVSVGCSDSGYALRAIPCILSM
jgi:hypothetical protein